MISFYKKLFKLKFLAVFFLLYVLRIFFVQTYNTNLVLDSFLIIEVTIKDIVNNIYRKESFM